MYTKTSEIFTSLFLILFNIQISNNLSYKIGNPVNTNIQTGQAVLFTSSLPRDVHSYFVITFPTAMSTDILEAAVSIVGTSYIIEVPKGFVLYANQYNSTSMTVQCWSFYPLVTYSSTVYYMKVRFLISCHPYVDIDYQELTFAVTDNVANPFATDNSCSYIRCRKNVVALTYSSAKSTLNNIVGVAFLGGFDLFDLPLDGDLAIVDYPSLIFTTQNYYGISLSLGSFGSTSCQLTVTVYGYTKINSVNVYYITYESTLTDTYKTRALSGSSSVGCYYTFTGCPNSTISNNKFQTTNTLLTTFFDNMYFYGLNSFIIYHDYNPNDFNKPNANSYNDPNIQMIFTTSSSYLVNTDVYETPVSFTGNPNNQFSFKFGYLIDLNFDCPSSGDIYHISNWQCNSACPTGYSPDPVTMYCVLCSSRCFQCTGPTNNDCSSCYTTAQHRILNGTTCSCQSLYYYDDTVSDICPACHYTCLSCFASGSSNCLTCNSTDFRLSDGASSCPCMAGYYDSGGPTCIKCHYSCATCSTGGSTNCITCPLNSFRNISANTCGCLAGYYDTGAVVCAKCLYSCKTCTTLATRCTSCDSTLFRSGPSGTFTCPCNNGYYDNSTTQTCQVCFTTCQWCNGPSKTDCSSCRSTDNRIINSPTGECLCKTGYFDYLNVCNLCHYTCLNCTNNTQFSCLNCNAALFRIYNSSTMECRCKDGYYDPMTTPVSTPMCQTCNPTCLTCSLISTYCLTCNPLLYRQLLNNSCPCIAGYVNVAGVCKLCHYSCQTCSGVLSTQCLSCNLTIRFVSGTSCPCRPGTYDNGLQQQCQPCHPQCLECVAATNSSCTVCDPAMKRITPVIPPSYCYCDTHYYDSGPAACSTCFSQCEKCQYNSTYCLTCYASQFRTLNSSKICQCQPHYYETGADICQTCAVQCYECSVISTNCTSCPALRVLTLNACPCVSNYYEDPTTMSCLQCNILCKLCQNSSTTCTACYSNMNRYLNNSRCDCLYGYYYDGVNAICQPCPYYCQNCSSLTVCLSCPANSHRFLNISLCKCMPGYYDDGNSTVCLSCSPICQQCNDYLVCTACNSTLHRHLSSANCSCYGKYYDTYSLANPTVQCQPCYYTCTTCFNGASNSCIICQLFRAMVNSTCPCMDGYYQNSQSCLLCNSICRTCSIISQNCTTCYSGVPLSNNTCSCYSGQYENNNVCYPCDPKCKECFGTAAFCTQCYSSQLTSLVGSDCVCLTGFKDLTTLTCTPCESTCLTCTGPTSTNCTSCNANSPTFRILDVNKCVCMTGYFLNSNNNSCVLCATGCSACVGASNYNCSACQTGYILIGSYCKFNLTCANYLYEGQCVNVCPKNSYPTASHICLKCTNNCLYCRSDTECLQCEIGFYYNASALSCSAICQSGTFLSSNNTCESCPSNCIECQLNASANSSVCLKCSPTFYLKESQCTQTCPIPYYQPLGSLCLKCVGNCLTCNSLSASDCVMCKPNTSFFNGQCNGICPIGYYKVYQKSSGRDVCSPCFSNCQSCAFDECLSCKNETYLSNGLCINYGYFYDTTQDQISQCHPNCISCTNTSFASCVLCQKHRGDASEMAISGYCECHEGSIDMGNGVCDYEKFTELNQITESLVSYSSSTFYLTALASVVSTNFMGVIAMLSYVQAYSSFYYLNSSMVMRVDYVLEEYRKSNINSYFHLQKKSSVEKRRALVQLQNDKSLFLRDQPFMYLIDWALIPTIIVILIWSFSLVAGFISRIYQRSNKITNIDIMEKTDDSQIQQKIKQKNQSLITLQGIVQRADLCNKIEQKNKIKNQKLSLIQKFHHIFYEGAPIIVQLLISSQIVFYAIVTFKVLREQENIQIFKLVLSIVLFIYFIIYSIRLIVGAYKSKKKNISNEYYDQLPTKNPLRLLFHMHLPQKNRPFNAIYLPLLILRNQIFSMFIVVLSSNSLYQILSCTFILLGFTVYSLKFSPYRMFIRICFHVSDVLFVLQLIILYFSSVANYGNTYNIQILESGGYQYKTAWIVLSLNFIQITIYALITGFILIDLLKKVTCNKQTSNHFRKRFSSTQGQVQTQLDNFQKDLDIKDILKGKEMSCQIIDLDQEQQMPSRKQNINNDLQRSPNLKDKRQGKPSRRQKGQKIKKKRYKVKYINKDQANSGIKKMKEDEDKNK